jgi:methyl-accepting chemotaxis protein
VKDPEGVYLFREFVKATSGREAKGNVRYHWQYYAEKDRVEEKASYVAKFTPWSWIIGTGVYVDDIEAMIKNSRKQVVIGFITIFSISLVLGFLMISKISNIIHNVINETKLLMINVRDGKLSYRLPLEKIHQEFHPIVLSFNEVISLVIKPIDESVSVIKEMAKGDLTKKIEGEYKGDYGILKNSLNSTIDSLKDF